MENDGPNAQKIGGRVPEVSGYYRTSMNEIIQIIATDL